MFRILIVAIVALLGSVHVNGHGYLLDPPNRSSMWRDPAFHNIATPNYQDNQIFCGGFPVQWEQNGGKCGLCGDNYASPQPRDNEHGGMYGQGVIGRRYHEGTNIQLRVELTAAHRGHFEFSICNMDATGTETEECFAQHVLRQVNGEEWYTEGLNKTGTKFVYVSLPEGLVCEHCVLRWAYTGGNNWGVCEDNSQAVGCGAQETFKTCSDISIMKRS